LVHFSAKGLLRLVQFAGSDDDGVFHGTHNDLRINPFFAADRVYRVVNLTCHIFQFPATSSQYPVRLDTGYWLLATSFKTRVLNSLSPRWKVQSPPFRPAPVSCLCPSAATPG